MDIAPTIAEWARINPGKKVNGVSFAHLLTDPNTRWRDSAFLEMLGRSNTSTYHIGNFQGVRTLCYLCAEYMNGDREL